MKNGFVCWVWVLHILIVTIINTGRSLQQKERMRKLELLHFYCSGFANETKKSNIQSKWVSVRKRIEAYKLVLTMENVLVCKSKTLRENAENELFVD